MVQIPIGLVAIFAIILVPVYIFVIASLVGRPRAPKVVALVLGLIAALLVLSVLFIWVLSVILSSLVP